MSKVQIRHVTKIPDALKAPCCASKSTSATFSSNNNITDISINISGASIATTHYACFNNGKFEQCCIKQENGIICMQLYSFQVDNTWCHVRHIPCSFLFHKTRPQLKSSQAGMLDTQWFSTQSMDLIAYMHFPLNNTSQIHFFRKYRFISRNKFLMKKVRHSLSTITDNEKSIMSSIR
jgi:hypothetical protein